MYIKSLHCCFSPIKVRNIKRVFYKNFELFYFFLILLEKDGDVVFK